MKVTVYIPAHNYGKYIEQAVESVLVQTITDWELIIINDGSTDNTAQILKKYTKHSKIRIIEQVKRGLNISNNVALRLANGQYIMRLDADDYLDENALLVLSNTLDFRQDVGLVYPDYYLMDENGEILEVVRRKKIGAEVELLDIPALGACTMFRKECLLELGGYTEEFDCQDGYELWLRFIEVYKPYNVNVPLFYYRQHPVSLTKNQKKILDTRRKIKRKFVEKFRNNKIHKVLAIIPVVKQPTSSPEEAFTMLAGKPLLEYTLREALAVKTLDKIVVTSNDEDVLSYASQFKGVVVVKRPSNLIASDAGTKAIISHVIKELNAKEQYSPEAVIILYINTPLRKSGHIEKAIDTMAIFDVDTVVAVSEELAYCYTHDKHGLLPIKKNRDLRIEKNAIYKEIGAIFLSKMNVKTDKNFYGKKVSHIVMLPEESVKIKSAFDLWLAEKIINDWRKDVSIENKPKKMLLMTSPRPDLNETPLHLGDFRPPLGLGFLAAVLRKAGHEVLIVDNYIQHNDLGQLINRFMPDMVGIYVHTAAFKKAVELIKQVRQLTDAPIAVGGPHASLMPESFPQEVNYVVVGEGEKIIVDLLEGKIKERIILGHKLTNNELNDLPWPDYKDFFDKPYNWELSIFGLAVNKIFSMNTSRGCPYLCKFCGVVRFSGRQYRFFSAKKIVDEIQHLKLAYNVDGIYFREDNFTALRKRLKDFCELMIERKLNNLFWACESRVDGADRKTLALMYKAGCRGLYVGVESGSQRVLDNIKKGITVEQIKEFFKDCRDIGIRTYATFCFGTPGETEEDRQETERIIDIIKPTYCDRFVYIGIPRSEFYDYIECNKLYYYKDSSGFIFPFGYERLARRYYGKDDKRIIPYEPDLEVQGRVG